VERFGVSRERGGGFLEENSIPTLHPLPPSLLAACLLLDAGLLREARPRLEAAIAATVEPEARSLYEVELADCQVASGDVGLAVRTLHRLARSTSVEAAQERARRRLWDLHANPAARGAFVDVLLEGYKDAARPAPEEVSAWGARLGADDPVERERACAELAARGREVVPLLRDLRGLDDPEVRERAEELLFAVVVP
jgi:hypothetical protein